MLRLKSNKWFFILILSGVIISAFVAFNLTQESKYSRQVLSTLTGSLFKDGKLHKIVKVKSQNEIFIEIYELGSQGESQLLGQVNLTHLNDGFFYFQGSATNLALSDIDKDGVPEIIAPTFDEELSAHLNVVKFNSETQNFGLLSGPYPSLD